MGESNVKVTLGEKIADFAVGTTYQEIVKKLAGEKKEDTVLVISNHRLRELHREIDEDCEISLITTSDEIGHKTYKRSMSFLMLKAFYDVAGRDKVQRIVVHYSVGEGYYYTVSGDVTVTQELLDRVKDRMRELVEQRIPITKKSVSRADAIRLFHQNGMYDKEKLFRYRRVSWANLYELDGFVDYYYGFMVSNTGYLRCFDLIPYDEGFVLQMPCKEQPYKLPVFQASPKIFQIQKESEKWGERIGTDMVGSLNDAISQGEIQRIMLIAEALQEGKISAIAEEIARRRGVKFVMIAGPSSSGKTTFSHRLSVQLAAHGLKPHPIGIDNYFVSREETPIDPDGRRDYECLEAVDVELFNKQMTALLNGERVEIPRFNFVEGRKEFKGDFLELGSEDVLVIEGIHGLNDKLSYSLPKENKFKIYISALTQLNIDEHNRIPTTDGRLLRRIVRDNRTRGTSAQRTIAMWDQVRKGEEENIFPYQEEADVMFNSALTYELSVLKTYAEPLLFQIPENSPEYFEAIRLLKFLDYFLATPGDQVANNSILREFIGGSCFDV